MVRPLRPRSVVGALAASAIATVLIAACGDQVPPQAKEHTGAQGTSVTVHDIAIRDAQITLNGDGTGDLSVVLFNKSTQADSLTSVTPGNSKTFTTAILPTRDEIGAVGNIGASATAFPNGTVSTSISFGPSFTPTVSGPASGAGSSSTSSSTSAAGSAAGASSVVLPATSGVFLNAPPAQIKLVGFPAGTLVGFYVPTMFTFATAGTVTLEVPVISGSDVTTSASQTVTPSASATAVPQTTYSPGSTISPRSATGTATPGSPQSTPATASSGTG